MFCVKCGAALPEGSRFCDQCGQAAGAVIAPPSSVSQTTPSGGARETSGKAVASLITGVFGLLLFPVAIAAIILGHMSRSEIRKSNGRLAGDGMATAGLVMGYGAFAVIPFILIIAAIAIPNLLRARIAANESSAVAVVRTLATAEVSYKELYPNVGYTCDLANLSTISNSSASSNHEHHVGDVVVSGRKHGYRFELRNCVNSATEHKYQVVAYPLVANSTGVRAFCSDESGVVKGDASGSPDECLAKGVVLE